MSEKFRIRVAGRGDIPAIDALLTRSYPRLLAADYPPSVLVTAIPLISRAQPALVTSGTYYVSEGAGGRIVGAGGWTRTSPGQTRTDPGLGNVRHFACDPDVTRRGIARGLMQVCQIQAREAGLSGLNCFSTRTAVPFYEAMGFEQIEEMEIPLARGIDFPSVRMLWRT